MADQWRDVNMPPMVTMGKQVSNASNMSLRDYFAACAMQGMQARDVYDEGQATPKQRARLAYLEADAMLAERDKP